MSTFLRQATNVARKAPFVRAISSTTAVRKDIVQDLYLREIRSYKSPPPAKDAHVGAVKAYTLPPAPKAPTVPVDLASELAAYDAVEPTRAEVAVSIATDEGTGGAEAYLAFLEQDLPKEEAHH